MTRRKLPRSVRLASGPALYVLNRAGRLALIPDDASELAPLSSADADRAIKASMAHEKAKSERSR